MIIIIISLLCEWSLKPYLENLEMEVLGLSQLFSTNPAGNLMQGYKGLLLLRVCGARDYLGQSVVLGGLQGYIFLWCQRLNLDQAHAKLSS